MQPFVFLNPSLKCFSRKGIRNIVKKYAEMVNPNKKITVHTLRRTFAKKEKRI